MATIMPKLASTKSSFCTVEATEPLTSKPSLASTLIHKLLTEGLPKRPQIKIQKDKSQLLGSKKKGDINKTQYQSQATFNARDKYQQNTGTTTAMPKNFPASSLVSKFINRQNSIAPNKLKYCLFSSAQGSANNSPQKKKEATGITTATTTTTATTG